MADLAEFETAPAGTERRSGSDAGWQTAYVGDKLAEGHESRNTQSNEYQVRLYSSAEMRFDSVVAFSVSNITGLVKYQNDASEWITITNPGEFTGQAIGTGSRGGVSVVCIWKGALRVPPFAHDGAQDRTFG